MRDRTHGQGLDTEEIRRFIAMVDARAIVYSKSFNEKFIKSISDGDTGIRYFIPITPAYDSSFDNKVIAFDQLLTCGRERVERDGYHYPIVRNREKLAEMLFTSGTTGTSKCVMLCQKNIFAAVNAAVETVCFSADDVVVSVLPIHHTYELMCIWPKRWCTALNMHQRLPAPCHEEFPALQADGAGAGPAVHQYHVRQDMVRSQKKSKKETILKAGLATSKTLMAVGIDARRKIFKSVLDAFGGRLDHIICGGAKLNPDDRGF